MQMRCISFSIVDLFLVLHKDGKGPMRDSRYDSDWFMRKLAVSASKNRVRVR